MARKPTHDLCMIRRSSGGSGREDRGSGGGKFQTIGAGWTTEKGGGISINLNGGTAISWHDMRDCALYVFPRQSRKDQDQD